MCTAQSEAWPEMGELVQGYESSEALKIGGKLAIGET